MLKCAIVGATGFTGVELAKILLNHSQVQVTGLTTRQEKTIPLKTLIPDLESSESHHVTTYSFSEVREHADLVFLCLPHTEAAETGVQFRKAGKVVIDLSADFRLREAEDYSKWYGIDAKYPESLGEAVYGLPEFYREKIKKADLIANPGCYPTSALLAVMPLLKEGLVSPEGIVIDSKSGTSGAGRNPKGAVASCEETKNFFAYKVGRHQHTPEIEQGLKDAAGAEVKVAFTTHLLPVRRGILSTVYLNRKAGVEPAAVRQAFEKHYAKEPFVRLKKEGEFPAITDVNHTNYCDIGCWSDPASDRVIVVSAIDNLLKGASGQAVQNMNIRFGFKETEGF